MTDSTPGATDSDTKLRGISPAVARSALAEDDPLPGATGDDGPPPEGTGEGPPPEGTGEGPPPEGTGDDGPAITGFAGVVDGRLVRDVLGRELVYSERADSDTWAFDPGELDDPSLVPAGHVRTEAGDRRAWSVPAPPARTDHEGAIRAVRAAVRSSVDAVAEEGLAVAFSGGVDSAAVATRVDAPLYVAGFPDSHDVAAARSAVDHLDRPVRVVELTHDDVERAVPSVVAATGRTNAMDVAIAVPLFLVAERAAADGYTRLAVGQGADELFGGYAKVAGASDDDRVAADTVRGARREVVGTLPGQLERDLRTLRAAGVDPVAPLLDDRVVAAALALPGDLLVADGTRKVALRRAVESWVPAPVAGRDKKALQYGSLVSRELDRLARQAGFKRRMDDHVTRYVESLADSAD